MTITEQLKAKAEALRTVQAYIDELRSIRGSGDEAQDELLEVAIFIEQQINNYKQLVQDLRKQHGE